MRIETDSQHYTDIAEAIREMNGTENAYYPEEMASAIRAIPQETMVHYDGTERIIGTWFGETLYQKTFDTSSMTINVNSSATVLYADYGITNVKDVVDCVAHAYLNGVYGSKVPYQIGQYGLTYGVENTQIQFYRTGSTLTNVSFKITLRYTKTSY